MTTTPTIDPAREALATAEAAVDAARAKLRGALADHDARGISGSPTVQTTPPVYRQETVADALAEARRRGNGRTRSDQLAERTDTAPEAAVRSTDGGGSRAAEGRAEALRRLAARGSR